MIAKVIYSLDVTASCAQINPLLMNTLMFFIFLCASSNIINICLKNGKNHEARN